MNFVKTCLELKLWTHLKSKIHLAKTYVSKNDKKYELLKTEIIICFKIPFAISLAF